MHVQLSLGISGPALTAAAPSHQVSISVIRNRSELSSQSTEKIEEPDAANDHIPTSTDVHLGEEGLLSAIELRKPAKIIMQNLERSSVIPKPDSAINA